MHTVAEIMNGWFGMIGFGEAVMLSITTSGTGAAVGDGGGVGVGGGAMTGTVFRSPNTSRMERDNHACWPRNSITTQEKSMLAPTTRA